MREHVAPEIRDDALADRHDQIESRRAGARQYRNDRDHHAEIIVDHRDAFGAEAEVDHAPHRHRHDQGGDRRNRE